MENIFGRPSFAYDLIYRPKETAFLRAAREAGFVAANGAGMKIPARIFLDAIDDMLLVQDQTVIRIGVATDVVGMEDFWITNAGGVRR